MREGRGARRFPDRDAARSSRGNVTVSFRMASKSFAGRFTNELTLFDADGSLTWAGIQPQARNSSLREEGGTLLLCPPGRDMFVLRTRFRISASSRGFSIFSISTLPVA